jgi:hypothetical protein
MASILYCAPDGNYYCDGYSSGANNFNNGDYFRNPTSGLGNTITNIRHNLSNYYTDVLARGPQNPHPSSPLNAGFDPKNFSYPFGKSEIQAVLSNNGINRRVRVKNIKDLGTANTLSHEVDEGLALTNGAYFRMINPNSDGPNSATRVQKVISHDPDTNVIEFQEQVTPANGVYIDSFEPKAGYLVVICNSAGVIRGPKSYPSGAAIWHIKGGTYKKSIDIQNMASGSSDAYFLIGHGQATFPLNGTRIGGSWNLPHPRMHMFNITLDGNLTPIDDNTGVEVTSWTQARIGSIFQQGSALYRTYFNAVAISAYNCNFIGPSAATLTSVGVAADYVDSIHTFLFAEANIKKCKFINWNEALRDHMLDNDGVIPGNTAFGETSGWMTPWYKYNGSQYTVYDAQVGKENKSYGAHSVFMAFHSTSLSSSNNQIRPEVAITNSNPQYAISQCTFINTPIPSWYTYRDCLFVNCKAESNDDGDFVMQLAEIGSATFTIGNDPYRFIKNNILAYTNGEEANVILYDGGATQVLANAPNVQGELQAVNRYHQDNNEITMDNKAPPYFTYSDIQNYGLVDGDLAKGFVPNFDEGFVDDAGAENETSIAYGSTHNTIGSYTFDDSATSLFVLRDGGGSGLSSHPYLKFDNNTWIFKEATELNCTYPAMTATAGTVNITAGVSELAATDYSVGDILILKSSTIELDADPSNIGEYVRITAINTGTGQITIQRYAGLCPGVDPDVRRSSDYQGFYGARVQTAGSHTVKRHIQHTKLVTNIISTSDAVAYIDKFDIYMDGNSVGHLVKSVNYGTITSNTVGNTRYATGDVGLTGTTTVYRPGDVIHFNLSNVTNFISDEYGIVLSNPNEDNSAVNIMRGIRDEETNGDTTPLTNGSIKGSRAASLDLGHDYKGIAPSIKVFWATDGSSLSSYTPSLATDTDDIAFLQGVPSSVYSDIATNTSTKQYDCFMSMHQTGYSKFDTGHFMGVFPMNTTLNTPIAYKTIMFEFDFFYNK